MDLLLEPCQISTRTAREYACVDNHYYDLIPYWNNDLLCQWILARDWVKCSMNKFEFSLFLI